MKKSDLANGVSYRFILKMFQAGEIQGISDAFARLFFAAAASAAVSAAVFVFLPAIILFKNIMFDMHVRFVL